MARYQIILAYDGTQFAGFQRQRSSIRTVQGTVENALCGLGWNGKSILSAGRTDSGVHAAGQVVAFDLDWTHTPQELQQALNALLPQDVAVRSVQTAEDDFHPRFAAVSRTYHYRIFCQEIRDPLRERFAWRVWPEVQIERLAGAAPVLLGTHDFAGFGSPLRAGGTTIRSVSRAEWQLRDGCWLFEISANAFLYHMVRRLVFILVQIGQKRLEVEDLVHGLQTGDELIPGLAPAHGLTLVKVAYADELTE